MTKENFLNLKYKTLSNFPSYSKEVYDDLFAMKVYIYSNYDSIEVQTFIRELAHKYRDLFLDSGLENTLNYCDSYIKQIRINSLPHLIF